MYPRLEAVVEYYPPENFKEWKVLEADKCIFIRLWAETTFEETGSVIAKIADYNQLDLEINSKEIIQSIIDEEKLVVAGGLQAVDENLNTISPSCCCGLEGWNEWLYINNERQDVWLGHDPSPWVQYLTDKDAMRIWSDGGLSSAFGGSPEPLLHIDFSMKTFEESLIRVQKDLSNFLNVLNEWAQRINKNLAEELVAKFSQDFNIQ